MVEHLPVVILGEVACQGELSVPEGMVEDQIDLVGREVSLLEAVREHHSVLEDKVVHQAAHDPDEEVVHQEEGFDPVGKVVPLLVELLVQDNLLVLEPVEMTVVVD